MTLKQFLDQQMQEANAIQENIILELRKADAPTDVIIQQENLLVKYKIAPKFKKFLDADIVRSQKISYFTTTFDPIIISVIKIYMDDVILVFTPTSSTLSNFREELQV